MFAILIMLQEVCYQYWPGESGTEKYGEFSVSTLETLNQEGFVQQLFSISDPKVRNILQETETSFGVTVS